MFGIQAIQIYFPKTYVDQAQYEKYKGVSQGKYTKGLCQEQLSFTYPFQDINSISLTVTNNLLKNNNIHPSQIGRLEVGTETLLDKSKSTKTILMQLFKGNHDIEGATSLNACYGATNALINTLNWITSPYWDGRYGIVVAADLAVYQDGPARPTGGAGAIAMLIGPKAKITFERQRASFMDHQWDFYKPIPSSQYPTVDGNLSIECYLNAVQECYEKLKQKNKKKQFLDMIDYFCFHAPFHKMVQKSFTKLMKISSLNPTQAQITQLFKQKVFPTTQIPRRVGNIYTGSLYSGIVSLLMNQSQISNKSLLLFSYGSGLCSTMMIAKIHSNPLSTKQINNIRSKLQSRIKISPEIYTKVMLERQKNFGKFKGKVELKEQYLDDNVFYLKQIDEKWRRTYDIKNPTEIQINKNEISALERLKNLNKHLISPSKTQNDIQNLTQTNKNILETQSISKFYKLSIPERIQVVKGKLNKQIDHKLLYNGGLALELADSMIENVVGKLSLPLAVVPMININNKKYIIPMCIEEPSVVAAVSSIGKFLQNHPFHTKSTGNIMIGQVHLPKTTSKQVSKIIDRKNEIVYLLNQLIPSMISRGGGVNDIRVRNISKNKQQEMDSVKEQYVVDIMINVCQAMGANITNMLCQKTKQFIQKMGIYTGIAILSNYCLERRASAWFEIQVKSMAWKGFSGQKVVEKVLEAYNFAQLDKHRATTHNKGVMNGIGAVCVATGQDWRAVESAAHAYACKNGQYSPLTHYQIIKKNGVEFFRGSIQLPISVGSKGGVVQKNSLYKTTMDILGNPTAQQLSQIMVVVGLAQNFAALRALAIQGIQKGHMVLHARTIAQKAGVPRNLIDQACQFMAARKKYDIETAKLFLQITTKPKL